MLKIFGIIGLVVAAYAGGYYHAGSDVAKWPITRKVIFIDDEVTGIKKTLESQSAAWTAGDIDRFMEDYWPSRELRFASGGTVKRGWQTTLDRYKSRYPDRDTMGALSFTDLEVDVISEADALVFGRWTLSRAQDAPTGLFTLHMKKFDQEWKIVSDHTSSASE